MNISKIYLRYNKYTVKSFKLNELDAQFLKIGFDHNSMIFSFSFLKLFLGYLDRRNTLRDAQSRNPQKFYCI